MQKIIQKNNQVDGDLVAGDKTVNIITPQPIPNQLKSLQQQFEQDCIDKPDLKVFIAAIQHYLDKIDGETVVGLEAKLIKGGRKGELTAAESLKEKFAKLLTRNQFSEAAQRIYTYMLGNLYESFIAYVSPLIEKNEDKSIVDKVLFEKVLSPLMTLIDENHLHIHPPELRGMLYFLTGNCHIQWHSNADLS